MSTEVPPRATPLPLDARSPAEIEAATARRERIKNWAALFILLSLGVVWPPLFAAPLNLDDVKTGSLLVKSGPDAEPLWALRQSTKIKARVTGNVARVRVSQQFTNPSDQWVEGFYVFPLSTGAAVDELEMIVGERRIRGEIKRKEEARATYEKAKREGKRASLVNQERPNMFTTAVANIAPRSSITVEIAYLDTIAYRDNRYTLNLPLAITPRYNPDVAIEATGPVNVLTTRSVNAILGTTATPEQVSAAPQKVEIEVELAPGFALDTVRSLNHTVSSRTTGDGRRITLQGGALPADRDFELEWTPAVAPDTQAAAFAERIGEESYALLMLTPPEMTAERSYKREVLFIIDTSGSMEGPSIEQARAALRLGVERLSPGDTFNVIRFSSDASSLFPGVQPVNAQTQAIAARFIDGLSAEGGTEMTSALELAFSMPADPESLRQLVFITDGSVSNEAELVSMIVQRIGEGRLFTVGIGAAPNGYFMREAAAAGRGSYLFIAQADQVTTRMADLFRKLEQPALVDLSLTWPGGMAVELASDLPSDLYAGDPLVIAARLPREPRGLLTLSGRSRGGAWVRQLPIRVIGGEPGLGKVWARERIDALGRKMRFGIADPKDIEAQIVDLALAHHLVSDYTSLVAVDVTPARPMHEGLASKQAPTAAPVGGAWARSTGFAGTATPAPLLLLIGIFALALASTLRGSGIRAR
jgi:Ca-activated chloride channel family protein